MRLAASCWHPPGLGELSERRRAAADPMKVSLSVSYELTHNGVDAARAGQVKSRLILAVTAALDGCGVVYSQAHAAPERTAKELKAD